MALWFAAIWLLSARASQGKIRVKASIKFLTLLWSLYVGATTIAYSHDATTYFDASQRFERLGLVSEQVGVG